MVLIVPKLSLNFYRVAFGFPNRDILVQYKWFDFCYFGLVKFYKGDM